MQITRGLHQLDEEEGGGGEVYHLEDVTEAGGEEVRVGGDGGLDEVRVQEGEDVEGGEGGARSVDITVASHSFPFKLS